MTTKSSTSSVKGASIRVAREGRHAADRFCVLPRRIIRVLNVVDDVSDAELLLRSLLPTVRDPKQHFVVSVFE